MITDTQLQNWFTYHPPTGDLAVQEEGSAVTHMVPLPVVYERIRKAGLDMAREVVRLTPASADQTAAIRKIREAVFTANAAIACDGR